MTKSFVKNRLTAIVIAQKTQLYNFPFQTSR